MTDDVASPAERLQRILEALVGQKAVLPGAVRSEALEVFAPTSGGLGYSQLNELLLLLGFDRVSMAFFQFLADGTTGYKSGTAIKSIDDLESGVRRFREAGILFFGNVKYAFKTLGGDAEILETRLAGLEPLEEHAFANRHTAIRPIRPIPPERTYYLGYVVEAELRARLRKNPNDGAARAEEQQRQEVVEIGKQNHVAYLASDHLDVYVATSMRQRHEFLAVNRLAAEIFGHEELSGLKLR